MNPMFLPIFFFNDDDSGSASPGRFAIFILSSSEEARRRISEAYSQMFEHSIHVIGFDEDDGYLQFQEVDSGQGLSIERKKKEKIETEETIRIDKFHKNVVLLVELFDEDGDPITENMLLTYYIQQRLNLDLRRSSV